jgi:acyl-CoA synthetase (AMP-forming)/AMP-acid ligase II
MMLSVEEARAAVTAPGQLFEMDEVEIGGVPTRVWKNAPGTLRNVLDLSSLHGDKTLVVYEDERMTFAEHYRAASTFARRLAEEYGVQKGDRVALAMRNLPEWVACFYGAVAIGAIATPLNAWWTGPELEYGLSDSGTKVLIADAERVERLLRDAIAKLRGQGTAASPAP